MKLWPRLHFSDGGVLDMSEGVNDWDRDPFEARWRKVHVRVEWMRTPKGRLDHLLPERYERSTVDNSGPLP